MNWYLIIGYAIFQSWALHHFGVWMEDRKHKKWMKEKAAGFERFCIQQDEWLKQQEKEINELYKILKNEKERPVL